MIKTPEELTKDWKEGMLEYGRYWVKNKVWEKPFIDRWLPNYSWEISCKKAIEQVLAPVPAYEEYKAMQDKLAEHRHYCCCLENEVLLLKLEEKEDHIADLGKKVEQLETDNKWLADSKRNWWHHCQYYIRESQNLRSLLKECYNKFARYQVEGDEPTYQENAEICDKINAALGESDE